MKFLSFNIIIMTLTVITTTSLQSQSYNYPKFNSNPISEKIFDTTIVDKYRDFETYKKNNTVLDFAKKQAAVTETYFSLDPLTSEYYNFLKNIDKNENDILKDVIIAESGATFYLKKKKSDPTSNIYYKAPQSEEEILLYNPRTYIGKSNKKYSISSFKPSWDGKKVVIGLRASRAYTSDIIILNVDTGVITNTGIVNSRPNEYLGLHWTPDNKAFTYTSLRHTDKTDPSIKRNTSLSIYTLESKETTEILGNGFGPKTDDRLFPVPSSHSKNDKYLISYIGGPGNHWDSYYISYQNLKKKNNNWKPLFKVSDKVYDDTAQLQGDNLIYISGKDSNFHTLNKLNLKTSEITKLTTQIENEIITDFVVTDKIIYFSTIKYGTQAFVYKFENDQTTKLKLPINGSKITLDAQDGKPNLWVNVNSPLSTVKRFKLNLKDDSFQEEFLYTPPSIKGFEDITYKTVEVASHDGILVPMTIIHKKNLQLNSNNPVFSHSYGAYGKNDKIEFKTHILSFVSLGGIVVYPHIRGGGAKGDSWHKAGMKTTKINSWKDLTACMNYLVEKKYTTNSKISMFGSSAGAVPIAMAVNENPNLVGAMILTSAVLNPFRKPDVYKSVGFVEYGSKEIKEEAKGLIRMDSYLNVPDSADFPAILLIHGLKDDRVYLHEPLKYITKVQESNTGSKPTLIFIDPTGTHSGTSFYTKYSRVFSFALTQTGSKVHIK